jgi:hypothetical protein
MARAEGPALLRIAHLSPDSPAVDVALTAAGTGALTDTGPVVAGDLAYGDVGDYRRLAPGAYAISVRAAGSPAGTPPALTERIDLPAGSARTVSLSGLFADLSLAVLTDDLSAPPRGSARVRVLSATGGAPVMVSAGRIPLAEGRYATVPAGPTTVRLDGREQTLDLAAGSVVTLVVLDGPWVQRVVDAAGAPDVPLGGVDAGLGPVGVPLVGAAVSAGLTAHPAAPPVSAAAPLRLRVPAAGIDAVVGAVAADAGVLAAPADPTTAGWFSGGPAPGEAGPAVLAGHVDWAGSPAVFAARRTVVPGDDVVVQRADGTTVRFAVTRVLQVPKDAFPTAEVYGPTPDAQLRLITCGGVFDRAAASYTDNVIVFARAR